MYPPAPKSSRTVIAPPLAIGPVTAAKPAYGSPTGAAVGEVDAVGVGLAVGLVVGSGVGEGTPGPGRTAASVALPEATTAYR